MLFRPPEFQFTNELCVPLKEYNEDSFQTDDESFTMVSFTCAETQKMLNTKKTPINDLILPSIMNQFFRKSTSL